MMDGDDDDDHARRRWSTALSRVSTHGGRLHVDGVNELMEADEEAGDVRLIKKIDGRMLVLGEEELKFRQRWSTNRISRWKEHCCLSAFQRDVDPPRTAANKSTFHCNRGTGKPLLAVS